MAEARRDDMDGLGRQVEFRPADHQFKADLAEVDFALGLNGILEVFKSTPSFGRVVGGLRDPDLDVCAR
jgi:hypothetical protein